MLGTRPGREVGPALSDQFERQNKARAVNLGDIAAEQAVKGGANIEGWVIGLLERLGSNCHQTLPAEYVASSPRVRS
ncbi:hypothetical protein QO004_006067 [Rhizobium mesoamericanum]|nr:hypothetical protein [Rhizobium mesoamericanum]